MSNAHMSDSPIADSQRNLLDLILDPVESDRVAVVADLLYQIEGYMRQISLSAAGLAQKSADSETVRDLHALQRAAEDVSVWLSWHWQPLYQFSHPGEASTSDQGKDVVLH